MDTGIVTINSNTVFSERLQDAVRTVVGIVRPVSIVDNWTDAPTAKNGTCWASCAGSMIEYYKMGASSDAQRASDTRHDVLFDRFIKTDSYAGGLSDVKGYIEQYVDDTSMRETSSSLAWAEVKDAIQVKSAPCYMRWQISAAELGHAMVLCGYTYENSGPNNTDYYRIHMMDPNRKSIQISSFGSPYYINEMAFSWSNTLIKI